MIRFSADWILPISDPAIGGGAVTIDAGRIVSVTARDGSEDVALGRVVVLPGLVNAHTHLELSYLHGRIPPASTFLDWVRPMLAARRERSRPDEPTILQAAAAAIQRARATGTAVIGDVTNTLAAVPLLAAAKMPACVFHELIGFTGLNADAQVAGARQAIDAIPAGEYRPAQPGSARTLFGLARPVCRDSTGPRRPGPPVSTVHLGESSEEVELLTKGSWSLANTPR